MSSKRVFIGSSSEKKPVAEAIARALAKKGYVPRRWWSDFPPGSVTIDRLMDIAKESDAAVFIAGRDDKVWYRGNSFEAPRDNVVLEYGIFLAIHGRSKCILVSDQTKIPTDLAGVSYLTLNTDNETTANEVSEHFDKFFLNNTTVPILNSVKISADPRFLQFAMAQIRPDSWHNRDLYLGSEGARNWMRVAEERGYSPAHFGRKLKNAFRTAASKSGNIGCLVSLGPGDAAIDKEIALQLRLTEPQLQYIPVDMSDGLLQNSVVTLGDRVTVPIGILADFEDRLNFVMHETKTYGVPPYLFAILGNTLGDLDNSESVFLHSLRSEMSQSDRLLLDVSIKMPKWTWQNDRRTSHASYGMAYRRFIAYGISSRSKDPIESIVSEFDSRIEFVEGDDLEPDGHVINIVDTKNGRQVCSISRYHFDSLKTWFGEHGFKILYDEKIPLDEYHGSGVFLVERA